jgi:hypothetical protein
MLVFGGRQRCGTTCSLFFNDVWQLTLGANPPTWTQIFPLGTPPPTRYHAGAIYDPVRDRMVIMGGFGTTPNGAWALSLSGTPTWTDLGPWGTPHWNNTFQAMYDPIRDRALVVRPDGTGRVSGLDFKLSATQPLWSQNWSQGANLGSLSGSTVYDPDDDLVILAGAADTSSYRLDFSGGNLVDAGGTNGSVIQSQWCYGSGEMAHLIAAPNQGYKFSQWIGDFTGTTSPIDVPMNAFKVIRAEFVAAVTGVDEPLPVAFSLDVHPNPAVGPAEIDYALPHATRMTLRVFDIAGREVSRLVDGVETAGHHRLSWSGTTANPRQRAGIYLVRFETPEGTWTKRVALLH